MASTEETGFQVYNNLSEDPLTRNGSSSSDIRAKKSWTSQGVVVTPVGIFIYVLITLAIAGGVGVIVHFAHPCSDCKCECAKVAPPPDTTTLPTVVDPTQPSLDDFWQKCVEMSLEREECLPGSVPCVTKGPETTSSSKPTTGYRLPSALHPYHYDLELRPDFYSDVTDNFHFDGHVDIFLVVHNATSDVILNAKQLTVTNVEIESLTSGVISVTNTSYDLDREFFKMSLESPLTVNDNIKISLQFEAPLLNDLIGLYWSSYQEAGETKYMAITQFAATDARKAFPCLDEPAFKATFNVTIVRKSGITAMANTPNYTSEQREDDWIADKFETTPVMSTYILAIAVADYSYLQTEAPGGLGHKEMKYYARPEAIDAGYLQYASDTGPPSFDFYEDYLNYPYALSKLDKLAVPDFAFSAMENWGLVTYKEVVLFTDPEYTSSEERRRLVVTNAHELAHQWFGNTVTCAWFDDVWLNEGLASYFEIFPIPTVEPTWDKWQLFTFDNVYGALTFDSSGRTVPIYNPVETPTEALDSYSTIAYEKAACVTRMVHYLILEESDFQSAMHEYLVQHEFSVSDHDGLINIWQEHADNSGLNVDVVTMMYTWIKQMGYPVIKITRDYDESSDNVHVTQKMFLQTPEISIRESYESEYDYKWEVPINVVSSNDLSESWWLHQDNRTFSLNIAASEWILGNPYQYGFYRVNYDEANWLLLINQLNDDHWVLDTINRAQLIDDSFHLARAGEMKLETALKTTTYLENETEWLPWKALKSSLQFVHYILYKVSDFGKFREYVQQLTVNNYQNMGWEDVPGDNITTSFLRTDILELACLYELPECLDQAQLYFNQWRADPTDMTIIRPDIRFAVYCSVVARGGVSAWDFLFEQYQREWHGPSGIDRPRIVRALACSTEVWALSRYFEMAATSDTRINPSDISSIMGAVAANPLGHTVAWDYLNTHWDTVPGRFDVLDVIVRRFSTLFDLAKLETFQNNHPPETEAETLLYEDLGQATRANIRFRDDNMEDVMEWINEVMQ